MQSIFQVPENREATVIVRKTELQVFMVHEAARGVRFREQPHEAH